MSSTFEQLKKLVLEKSFSKNWKTAVWNGRLRMRMKMSRVLHRAFVEKKIFATPIPSKIQRPKKLYSR